MNSEKNTFIIELYGPECQKACLTFQNEEDAREADKTLTEAIKDKKNMGSLK